MALSCKCSNDWIDNNHHLSIHVKNAVNLCPACVTLHVNHRLLAFTNGDDLYEGSLEMNRMPDQGAFTCKATQAGHRLNAFFP